MLVYLYEFSLWFDPGSGAGPRLYEAFIFEFGLINDVGTCAWLSGRCAVELHRYDEARQAFTLAATYTYARCWDPVRKDFFSVAQRAKDDLDNLNEKNK